MARAIQVCTVVLFIIFSWQCIDSPLEPVLPTWDVDLSLPLIHRTYSLQELVDKNPDVLSTNANGIIVYTFSDTIHDEPIGELVKLRPSPSSFSFEMGLFTISPIGVEFSVPVEENLPFGSGYEGASPGFGPVNVSGEIPEIESIDFIVLESGLLILGLTNESGVPIELPDGIEIRNAGDNSLVAVLHFPDIVPHGATVTAQEELYDVRVENNLEFAFAFSSPPDDNVQIPDDPSITFSFALEEMLLREARAQIPRQTLTGVYTGSIVLDDSTSFREVSFSEGALRIALQHSFDLDEVPMTVEFPTVYPRGNPHDHFSVTRIVHRNVPNVLLIDLSEWTIRASGGDVSNMLEYSVRFGTIEPAHDFRTLRSSDEAWGEVGPHLPISPEFIVERIEGVISPTQFSFEKRVPVDLGDVSEHFGGEVSFGDATLSLSIFFDGGFNSDADITIHGTNAAGVQDSIVIPEDQRRLLLGEWNTIVLNKDNSRINDFFSSFVPTLLTELQVFADLLINPDVELGVIDRESKLDALLHLDIPFDIGIRGGVVRDTVGIGESGGNDVDRDIFDYLNYGKLYFESENGIPLGIELKMNLLSRDGSVLREFPLPGEPPVGVPPGPIDASRRSAGSISPQVRVLELTREDVQLLRDADKAELLLNLQTNEAVETVVFRASDFIRLRIFATFNIRADFN